MREKLEQIKAEALGQIEESGALEKLNEIRIRYLGKKGELTQVLKGMKDVAPQDRPSSRTSWKKPEKDWLPELVKSS